MELASGSPETSTEQHAATQAHGQTGRCMGMESSKDLVCLFKMETGTKASHMGAKQSINTSK